MKTIAKNLLIVVILMLTFSIVTLSQPPRVWQNGDGSGVGASATSQGSSTPVNGPLDDGLIPLLIIASVYCAIKYYSIKKEEQRNLSLH